MTDINVKHKAISQNKASICGIQINPKTNVFFYAYMYSMHLSGTVNCGFDHKAMLFKTLVC